VGTRELTIEIMKEKSTRMRTASIQPALSTIAAVPNPYLGGIGD
jgi:hypothetical protein